MKRINLILIILLITILTGCESKNSSTKEFITVDVTANYPQKEFILQDLFDVEYVPLETTDEFVTTGNLQAIDKEIMLVKDMGRIQSGNIHITDRNGNFLRTINRLGQGAEEYTYLRLVVYDKENQEMYVNDIMANKVLVYDLNGNFKRSFKAVPNIVYQWMGNFDRNYLICYSEAGFDSDGNIIEEGSKNSGFMLVSKQDGSIQKISIPYEELIPKYFILDTPQGKRLASFYNEPVIPYQDSWLLTEISADTIYRYSQDHTKKPFIVRTPSVHSMNPEILLFPGVITDRYYFMQTVKRVYDFEKHKGFPTTELVYDKQENAIYRYIIYNSDFMEKKPLNLVSEIPIVLIILNNDEIAYTTRLEAPDLIDAYERGKLKGKLKEIAAGLTEESNPVMMIVKYKK